MEIIYPARSPFSCQMWSVKSKCHDADSNTKHERLSHNPVAPGSELSQAVPSVSGLDKCTVVPDNSIIKNEKTEYFMKNNCG